MSPTTQLTDLGLAHELTLTAVWIAQRETVRGIDQHHLERIERAIAFLRGQRGDGIPADFRALIRHDAYCAAIAAYASAESRGAPNSAASIERADDALPRGV